MIPNVSFTKILRNAKTNDSVWQPYQIFNMSIENIDHVKSYPKSLLKIKKTLNNTFGKQLGHATCPHQLISLNIATQNCPIYTVYNDVAMMYIYTQYTYCTYTLSYYDWSFLNHIKIQLESKILHCCPVNGVSAKLITIIPVYHYFTSNSIVYLFQCKMQLFNWI